ncbi:MAG: nuclear transport factor 2 family protein [Myxococcales bacterium]|nr:nuclear transport factor 2 family protein [Myxococcales bacterium]
MASLVACKRGPSQSNEVTLAAASAQRSDTAAAPQGDVTAPQVAPQVAPAAVNEVDPGAVSGLLAQWLAAQNQGQFDAYQRLYAARFSGVRRSGPRVARYDRAGWLRDRETMFRTAMQVSARDVAVSTGPQGATVRFVQVFTQGRYHDEGPKELVLVRAGAGLEIAREEMLSSRLGDPASTPAAIEPAMLGQVRVVEGVRYVLLAKAPDDRSWSQEPVRLLDRRSAEVSTLGAANGAAIPEGLRGFAGQSVRAYTADGRRCEARLGALAVLGQVDVHFGVEARWAGQQDDGTPGAPLDAATVGREAWAESDGGMFLVAPLEGSEGCAAEPRVVRLASQPEVKVYLGTAADAALSAQALAQVRGLAAWRQLQIAYRAQAPNAGPWDSLNTTSPPRVTVWQAEGAPRRFVTVVISAAGGGCADFSGEMTVVFEQRGAALTLHSDAADPGAFVPLTAVDVDGDGVPEFVTANGFARRTGAVFRVATPWQVPYHDCPC